MFKLDVNRSFLKRIFIAFFAIIAFLTTIKLAVIYYESNFDPYALPSFCSINSFIDCDGVAQTTHSQFLGIPLAYWGMFLYVFILFLLCVEKLSKQKFLSFLSVFKNPLCYLAALGIISFVISIILAIVSIFEIKKICILCVFTYLLNLVIALFALSYENGIFKGIFDAFKTSIIDFFTALKDRKNLFIFLLIAFFAVDFLIYTSMSYVFTPQVKRFKSINAFAKLKDNPYAVTGNVLGDENPKFVIDIYSDYRCPVCYTENLMIHRVAQEMSGFKVEHHNLPLDIECNKYLQSPFHEGSCMLARYAVAAEEQGRLWDINSEFFEKQPKTEDDVLKLAKSLGYDTIKLRNDANSKETIDNIKSDIDSARELGIEGTPAIVIHGRVFSGVKPYYELKDILIKEGASERK